MLIPLLLALLCVSEVEVVRTDFSEIRRDMEAQKWSKARKGLTKAIKRVVEAGGAMDGGDLVHAVRLRAMIEAGSGKHSDAAWWWHAGLNLQSEGADSVLRLISEPAATRLRDIRVRPIRPPKPRNMAKGLKERGKPASALYRQAHGLFEGHVKIEAVIGPRLSEPLLIEATVPTVAIYIVLDELAETRISAKKRTLVGDGETERFVFLFRGRR